MALIANINGKDVFSDKRVASIVNTRVTFTDGSWCDVSTGAVHNAGSGFINIGGVDTQNDGAVTTEGPTEVIASALSVRGISADVEVTTHAGRGMIYTITGPEPQVKSIRCSVRSNELVIEGEGSPAQIAGMTIGNVGSQTVIRTGRGRMVVASDNIVITSGSLQQCAVRVSVKVPNGTPINIERIMGNVNIGDTCGPLTASVQSSNLRVGCVTNTQVSVQGAGEVRIREVNGSFAAQVQGSGNVEVESGSMPSVTATVQGSGDIVIGGIVTAASLTVQGSGDIRVAHALTRPLQNVMGSGDIRVHRVG